MELIKFLETASDAEVMGAVVEFGGYALLLIVVVIIGLLVLNSTGQAQVSSRRF